MWSVAPLSIIQELKKEKKIVTNMCCHVGRNNRDLIRNIVAGFRLL